MVLLWFCCGNGVRWPYGFVMLVVCGGLWFFTEVVLLWFCYGGGVWWPNVFFMSVVCGGLWFC